MKAIRSNRRALIVLGIVAASSGCVAPKAPPPVPPPAPAPPKPVPPPAPLPAPPADWRDAAQTPGTWSWSNANGRSTASFAAAGGAPLASLTCDKSAGVVLLARQSAAIGATPIQITTSTGSSALISDPARSPAGWLVVALRARDPLLDAMAFSRGRFALESTRQAPLYLPSWPELSRVIEDCR